MQVVYMSAVLSFMVVCVHGFLYYYVTAVGGHLQSRHVHVICHLLSYTAWLCFHKQEGKTTAVF